jgi:hypothetical protein
MDTLLFESLLNEGESTTLDFKKAQYKFTSATDDEKSELLKDILAFANAWRHTPAYILIGVREDSASRSTPLGIEAHIDDANLQQFVNSKTNQPVNFKYYSFQFEAKSIGIIEIDVQVRPIYLKKKFGKVEANTVYLRRGSSTTTAALEEISRMGAAVQQIMPVQLDLQFAATESRSLYGKAIDIESVVFTPRIDEAMIRHRIEKNVFGGDNLAPYLRSPLENQDFPVDVFRYGVLSALVTEVNFYMKNNGNQAVTNLKVTIAIDKTPGLVVLDASSFPEKPQRTFIGLLESKNPVPISVTELQKSFEASFLIDRLLPGDTFWSKEGIYIGGQQNMKLNSSTRILADQIPQPIVETFTVTINTRIVNRTLDEWMCIAFEYE